MTRTRHPQNSLSSGEISPLLRYRFDYQRYQTGVQFARGYIPLRQGALTRAPGTILRGFTHNDLPARRLEFEFAENDAVELEFTAGRMRVWRYGALVMSGGVPYELATPYDADDIARLSFVQSADRIYLADGQHPIQRLSRFALDSWTIEDFRPTDGPFRVFNLNTNLNIQASAVSGVVTLTASGPVFEANHVGTLMKLEPVSFENTPTWEPGKSYTAGQRVRYERNTYELVASANSGSNPPQHTEGRNQVGDGVTWDFLSGPFGVVEITAVTNDTTAQATVIKRLPEGVVDDPTYLFSEGAWSDRHGYPALLVIPDDVPRLIAARTKSDPRMLFFAAAGSTEIFEEGENADDAFSFAIGGSSSVNSIQWLASGSSGLYVGTLAAELATVSTDDTVSLTPTTTEFRKGSAIGGRQIRPAIIDGNPVFVAKDGQRIFEISYNFSQNRNNAIEISLPSRHIGQLGLEQVKTQSAPEPFMWCRLATGDVAIWLRDRQEDVLGASVVPIAGGFVEDITVTPAANGGPDVFAAIVRRILNGVVRRCVEEFAPVFVLQPESTPVHEAVHLFCCARFQNVDPTDTFSVPHLANEEVYAWTDAGGYGPLTVDNSGQVVLPAQVSNATIGLFDSTHLGKSLPLPASTPEGNWLGRVLGLQAGMGIAMHRTVDGIVEAWARDFAQPEIVSRPQDMVPLELGQDLVEAFTGVRNFRRPSHRATEVGYQIRPRGGAPQTLAAVAAPVEEAGA